MSFIRGLLLCGACFLAAASSALADGGPNGIPGIPKTSYLSSGTLPPGSQGATTNTTNSAAGSTHNTSPPAPRTLPKTGTAPPAMRPKLTKRCTWSRRHHRGTRTCKFYRDHRLTKKCVKRPRHRAVCHQYRNRRAVNTTVRAAGVSLGSGFLQSPQPAVVRIHWSYTDPQGQVQHRVCSGSLIGNGLVLTAGHCVYSNQHDGADSTTGEGTGFVNYFDLRTYEIVPGEAGYTSDGSPRGSYGTWSVKNMWTTSEYASVSLGGDWGLIELSPDANGNYPGPSTGTYNAIWSQPTIHELYSIGYPTAAGFGQAQYGFGYFQYHCNTVWDAQTDVWHDPTNPYNNYFPMDISPCAETGGASGGPVFTDTDNNGGNWTIVGVNNRGPRVTGTQFSTDMMSFYFDDNFGSFYNYVVSQITQGY
jgi:hypothetical protein